MKTTRQAPRGTRLVMDPYSLELDSLTYNRENGPHTLKMNRIKVFFFSYIDNKAIWCIL